MKPYLDLAKKNVTSLICGIIVVAAIIAVYGPISGYFQKLKTDADARKASYAAMTGVLTKPRHLPVASLDGSAQGEELKVFPTEAVSVRGAELIERVKTQAKAMLAAAVTDNQHGQLVANALPNGSPEPAGIFRREYARQFDFMSDATRADSFPVKIMKAGFPPTDQQISAAKQKATDEINAKKAFAGNEVLNQPSITAELLETLPKVADNLKTQAAQNCLVYVEPGAFHQYQGFSTLRPGDFPTPGMLFNAQAGLWIQEDVGRAIADANRGAKDVTAAAVKHLIKVELADEIFRQSAAAAAPGDAAVASSSSDPSQTLAPNFAVSLTGRTSNGLYDVVPFTMRIDVDVTQLPKVLRAISANRFVNVLNVNVTSVDVALLKANGFYYGDKPVVTLDMVCEELLLREWTVPLMPLNIKQAMGIGAAAPTAAPTPSSAG